jgi:hypothetical protein
MQADETKPRSVLPAIQHDHPGPFAWQLQIAYPRLLAYSGLEMLSHLLQRGTLVTKSLIDLCNANEGIAWV